ncbi:peptide chain release factor 1 [Arenimonas maotaiensis]|uniref:Peptide chain release factor 1 n=1 Tax=Arenimonas maotaiensis TaxID=1446479 RepID=A0A917CJQ4_9GAMM|nr:peptide chain release factor 1 [Arenimonas maotaiensis]GGF90995.1 peptide chain release factor 1 [Arenimonas maotaiensis]
MLSPNLLRKLESLAERHEEVGRMLSDATVISDNTRFRELSQEYARLDPVAAGLAALNQARRDLQDADSWRDDPEMRALADEEMPRLKTEIEALENRLGLLLIPADARDEANLFLEIRAGTGGDEAALFAGDLFRMYARYAEKKRWPLEVLSANPGEHGGYREIIARIEGRGAFSKFKFESGTHRVQRVPDTETQGRIHTSAATVAILPEMDDIADVDIAPGDIKTDTFRASGAGGQHVNKTDSAIRITHLPTGIVVECQDERSQHKNRARAMSLLKARLLDEQRAKQNAAQAESRRLQVGSGDRSQRIRTYNFPQGRITDHRVEGLTLYKLPEILAGDLDELIERLTLENQADELKLLTEGAA